MTMRDDQCSIRRFVKRLCRSPNTINRGSRHIDDDEVYDARRIRLTVSTRCSRIARYSE